MRKRIVVALLAIVVVGGVAFLLTRPKDESIEWHKDEYLAAMAGNSALDRLQSAWGRITERHWRVAAYKRQVSRMERHRTALIKLGYLKERSFVVSNRPVQEVMRKAWSNVPTNMILEFVHVETPAGTNRIRIVSVQQDMPEWEELIRKADVP